MRTQIPCLLTLLAVLAGCDQSAEAPAFSPRFAELPTQAESTGPRLSGGANGELVLSWMERDADGAALRYARFENGAWGSAETVVNDAAMFVNWADLPSVVTLDNGGLAAHWLRHSGESMHAYDIVFTQSWDGGGSWSDPVTPHDDGTATEHGFVSIARAAQQTILIWLDGRKMANNVTVDPAASGMTLRTATIDSNSRVHAEQLLDGLVCDCCQTDIGLTTTGPIAVYRDRSVGEIRDIAVTRWIEGRWTPGTRVAKDDWEIAGCPVNGPAITTSGSDVAVAWFTAAVHPVVRLARSDDAGASFADAVDVIRSATDGKVGAVFLDDGDIAVSWLQTTTAGSALQVRRIGSDGVLGEIRTVSNAAKPFSVPQMARAGNHVVFAWTEETRQRTRVATAYVDVAAL